MQVFIRSPVGLLAVEVPAEATVQSIVDGVSSQYSLEAFDASLVYAGSYLSAETLISEAGITEVCSLSTCPRVYCSA